jgi:hypothetical protein
VRVSDRRVPRRQQRVLGDRDAGVHDHDVAVGGSHLHDLTNEAMRDRVAPLYIDSGTPNANLTRAAELAPRLVVGRTIGSGRFSPLEVPEQINAMLKRFLTVDVGR